MRYYNAVLIILACATAACKQQPKTTLELLDAGSPKACVTPDVINRIIDVVTPDRSTWNGPEAHKYPNAKLMLVSAAAVQVKAAEHTAECQVTLALSLDGKSATSAHVDVPYNITPDLSSPGTYTVRGDPTSARDSFRIYMDNVGITG